MYQIDLVPTLASLLGLPIPQNSLGALIPDVLLGFDARQVLSLAFRNAQQLAKVLEGNVLDHKRGTSNAS